MAYNNYQPFWDFMRQFDPQAQAQAHGAGVDHPPHPHPPPPPGAFPFAYGGPGFFGGPHGGGPRGGPHAFGPGHFGRGGRRGRGRFDHPHEGPHEGPHEHSEDEAREGSPHGPRHGFGRHGGRGGHHGHRGPPPPPFGGPGGFDLSALLQGLSAHPLAQAFRTYAEQAAAGQQSGETTGEDVDNESSFTPPIDVFTTETQYVLHVALPGAKKEDVGINWDAEKGVLNIAGVVYRQGDEEFLKTLSQSERKVGVFERTVKLPPGNTEEKDEVDGDAITAKLEDGVLVVKVPKVEKEWTEVKRVDIQ